MFHAKNTIIIHQRQLNIISETFGTHLLLHKINSSKTSKRTNRRARKFLLTVVNEHCSDNFIDDVSCDVNFLCLLYNIVKIVYFVIL